MGEDEARAVRQHPDATRPIAKLRMAAFPTATQIAAIRHDRFTSTPAVGFAQIAAIAGGHPEWIKSTHSCA